MTVRDALVARRGCVMVVRECARRSMRCVASRRDAPHAGNYETKYHAYVTTPRGKKRCARPRARRLSSVSGRIKVHRVVGGERKGM